MDTKLFVFKTQHLLSKKSLPFHIQNDKFQIYETLITYLKLLKIIQAKFLSKDTYFYEIGYHEYNLILVFLKELPLWHLVMHFLKFICKRYVMNSERVNLKKGNLRVQQRFEYTYVVGVALGTLLVILIDTAADLEAALQHFATLLVIVLFLVQRNRNLKPK